MDGNEVDSDKHSMSIVAALKLAAVGGGLV